MTYAEGLLGSSSLLSRQTAPSEAGMSHDKPLADAALPTSSRSSPSQQLIMGDGSSATAQPAAASTDTQSATSSPSARHSENHSQADSLSVARDSASAPILLEGSTHVQASTISGAFSPIPNASGLQSLTMHSYSASGADANAEHETQLCANAKSPAHVKGEDEVQHFAEVETPAPSKPASQGVKGSADFVITAADTQGKPQVMERVFLASPTLLAGMTASSHPPSPGNFASQPLLSCGKKSTMDTVSSPRAAQDKGLSSDAMQLSSTAISGSPSKGTFQTRQAIKPDQEAGSLEHLAEGQMHSALQPALAENAGSHDTSVGSGRQQLLASAADVIPADNCLSSETAVHATGEHWHVNLAGCKLSRSMATGSAMLQQPMLCRTITLLCNCTQTLQLHFPFIIAMCGHSISGNYDLRAEVAHVSFDHLIIQL